MYVQVPPPEMKSVTKNQPTTVEMSAMKGKPERSSSTLAPTRMRNSSERWASDQPPKAEFQLWSQPNHHHARPTKAPHAITEAKEKMPAATQRSRNRTVSAMNRSTTSRRSAHPVSAPLP